MMKELVETEFVKENEVICQICMRSAGSQLTWRHLKNHDLTVKEYKQKFGMFSTHCLSLRRRFSKSAKEVSERPEEIVRRRKVMKDRWADPVYAKNQTALANAPDSVRKRQKTLKDKWATTEFYIWMRRILDSPEVTERKNGTGELSGPHREVKSLMIENELYDGFISEKWIEGKFRGDEVDIERKLIIEVQGCFRHGCITCRKEDRKYDSVKDKIRRDEIKREYSISHGWKLLEVWEHELKDKETLVLKLREFVGKNVLTIV